MRLRRVTAAVFCVGVALVFILGINHYLEFAVRAGDPFWSRLLTVSMALNGIGLWSIILSAKAIQDECKRAERISRLDPRRLDHSRRRHSSAA
jgi:hypothetical protein